jgi:hypothetical protein
MVAIFKAVGARAPMKKEASLTAQTGNKAIDTFIFMVLDTVVQLKTMKDQ